MTNKSLESAKIITSDEVSSFDIDAEAFLALMDVIALAGQTRRDLLILMEIDQRLLELNKEELLESKLGNIMLKLRTKIVEAIAKQLPI